MQHRLFEPLQAGALSLSNRIVMAPMTRSRADAMGVQPSFAADYYAQRASAGLIITEGIQPSFEGQGYSRTPGVHTPEQIAAWRKVTDAVHEKGGTIVAQIMHVGRIAHPLNRQTDAQPVAPSAITPDVQMWTDQEGMQPVPAPRELAIEEIPDIIDVYVDAARKAREAGFDGVEFHAASGYLPNQFLSSNTNHRTDEYGGSPENRVRFVVEALTAIGNAIGMDRVGIKISPKMGFNDLLDENPEELFSVLVRALSPLGLAYLHVAKHTDWDPHPLLRPQYEGVYFAGGGLRAAEDGESLLEAGLADGTVWGASLLANPDLVERFKQNGPLTEPKPDTFFTPGPEGYTDYPFMEG